MQHLHVVYDVHIVHTYARCEACVAEVALRRSPPSLAAAGVCIAHRNSRGPVFQGDRPWGAAWNRDHALARECREFALRCDRSASSGAVGEARFGSGEPSANSVVKEKKISFCQRYSGPFTSTTDDNKFFLLSYNALPCRSRRGTSLVQRMAAQSGCHDVQNDI